jgi:hypothetical protein
MEMLSLVAAALREEEQQAEQQQQQQQRQDWQRHAQQERKPMEVDRAVAEVSSTGTAAAACREEQQQASSSGRLFGQQEQVVWESVVVGALGCQQGQLQELISASRKADSAAAVGKPSSQLEQQQQVLQDRVGKGTVGSPVSPVETSQSSDLTCHADSPRPVTVPLTSWPSSSTEGDSDKSSDDGPHAAAARAGASCAKLEVTGGKVVQIKGSSSSESLLRRTQDLFGGSMF